MDRLRRLVERSFFHATDSRSLSLFRFLYCALCAYQLWASAAGQMARHAKGIFHPIPLFQLLGVGLFDAETFALVRWITIVALVLGAIGLFTRIALTAAWIGFFLYAGTTLSFTKDAFSPYVTHTENIVVFVLMILSVAPGIAIWGVDGLRRRGFQWMPAASERQISAWPTQLVKLVFGFCYFGAGYCKVASHPLWADGYTLQAYFLQKHMLVDNAVAQWMAQHWWLCLFAGIGTLVLELTFFIVPFVPRAVQWLYVAAGVSFHTMIWLTMSINFFPYWGWVYLVFLDWPTLEALGRFLTRGFRAGVEALRAVALSWPSSPLLGATRFARGFSVAFSVVMLVCIFAHIEAWPFSDFRVFQKRNHYRLAHVWRLAGVDENGERSWLTTHELVGSPVSTNRRIRRSYQAKDQTVVARELTNNALHLPDKSKQRYVALQLVSRTVAKDEDAPGGFRIVDTPILAVPVTPTEIGEVDVLCDYLNNPERCDPRPGRQVAAPPPSG